MKLKGCVFVIYCAFATLSFPRMAQGDGHLADVARAEEACLRSADLESQDFDPDLAVRVCTTAADAGSVESQVQLARLYAQGNAPGGQDLERAFSWLKKAASGHNSFAEFQVANMLFDGFGVSVDRGAALKWMNSAAQDGHTFAKRDAEAMRRVKGDPKFDALVFSSVGEFYLREGNRAAAFRWYKRSAELGLPSAEVTVGEFLLFGYGIDQNAEMALSYLEKAARQGAPEGLFQIGMMYEQGRGVPQNSDMATQYLESASEKGHPAAMYELGAKYHDGTGVPHDLQRAIGYWRRSAELGHAPAQVALGRLYIVGQEVPQDTGMGLTLLTKAGESGDADAQEQLGELYLSGLLGKPDIGLAKQWLIRAVEQQRSPKGAVKLGKLLLADSPEAGDIARALELFEAAAKSNDRSGLLALAEVYQSDRWGVKSLERAYMWANLAVAVFPVTSDWVDAVALRRALVLQLDGASRERATQKSVDWMKENFPRSYFELRAVGADN